MIRYKYIVASILVMFLVMSYANYKDNKRNELYNDCMSQFNSNQSLVRDCMDNK